MTRRAIGRHKRYFGLVSIAAMLATFVGVQPITAMASTTRDTTAHLTLPWTTGGFASFRGGPHNWNGCINDCSSHHPWNSLDFASADSFVRAVHAGIVHTRDCGAGMVRIDHGDGFQTTYYHLDASRILVQDLDTVARGQALGYISYSLPCGGSIYCNGASRTDPVYLSQHAECWHTHFSLWYVPSGTFSLSNTDSEGVDWGGYTPSAVPYPYQTQIGSWALDDGATGQYSGCMTPAAGGSSQCPGSASIYGDGTMATCGGILPATPHLVPAIADLSGTTHIFVRGTDGSLYHRTYDGTTIWPSNACFGSGFQGSPAAVSFQTKIFLIVRGDDLGGVQWAQYDGSTNACCTWNPLGTTGAAATDPVATVFTADNKLHVLVQGTDNTLWETKRTFSGAWETWRALDLNVAITGKPAVAEQNGKLIIVARRSDNVMIANIEDANGGLSGWSPIGLLYGVRDPAITVYTSAQAQLFVYGGDNQMWTASYSGGWSGWGTGLGGMIVGNPSAITDFYPWAYIHGLPGGGNALYSYELYVSTSWSTRGGILTNDPVPYKIAGEVHVFVRGTPGDLWDFNSLTNVWTGLGGQLS